MNISLELIAIVALWLTTMGFLISLHRDVAGLRERMGHLEGRMGRLEDRMTHLEDRMSRLEDRMDQLEDRAGRIEGRMDHLEELFQGFRKPAAGFS